MQNKSTPDRFVEPRPFFGKPVYLAGVTLSRARRALIQLEGFERLLEDTPLIALEVEKWHRLSGIYLGLRAILGMETWEASWAEVLAFKKGERGEDTLCLIALLLHCFEAHRDLQWKVFARDTGYYKQEWVKLRQNPSRLSKHREQNRLAQQRCRSKRKEQMLRAQDAASLLPLAAE